MKVELALVYIAFVLFPSLTILGAVLGFLSSPTEHFFVFMSILVSVLILGFDGGVPNDVGHFLYCGAYLLGVTFLSCSQYLLALNVAMILCIMATRYYFGVCLLNKKQKNKGFFTSVNKRLKEALPVWDWEYIYPVILVICLFRTFFPHTGLICST